MKQYDLPEISSLYFFPRETPSFVSSDCYQPVHLQGTQGLVSALWCRYVQYAPTALFFYGNGETASDYLGSPLESWLMHSRVNLMLVDYPGYGASAGDPSLSSCCETAARALSFLLDQEPAEVPKVWLMGRSVGSIFALDAASKSNQAGDSSRVAGLILESAIADLSQRLDIRVPYAALGISKEAFHAEVAADFDHQRKIQSAQLPTLILHCKNDSLVPAWHGEQLADWAGPALSKLVLFPRGDHNTIHVANARSYEQALGSFLRAAR